MPNWLLACAVAIIAGIIASGVLQAWKLRIDCTIRGTLSEANKAQTGI